jgi:hypothetical protein
MKAAFVVAALLALSATACYMPAPRTSKAETLSRQVELARAESVHVEIGIGVGELRLSGGSDRLLDADFRYNIPDWKPEVSYEVENGLGRLEVSQPSTVVGVAWPSNVRYNWDLRLSDKVPMDLDINFGVGKSQLDLRGLNLRRLKVEAGVGEGTIDLSGPRQSDLSARIEAGVGRLVVLLPTDVGVEAEVRGGIGKVHARGLVQDDDRYHNSVWGSSARSIRLEIEGGIGEVELRLAGDRGETS